MPSSSYIKKIMITSSICTLLFLFFIVILQYEKQASHNEKLIKKFQIKTNQIYQTASKDSHEPSHGKSKLQANFPAGSSDHKHSKKVALIDQKKNSKGKIHTEEGGKNAANPIENTDWYSKVKKKIQDEEYHITCQENSNLTDIQHAYQTPNRAQNLRAYFTEQGISVIRRTETTPTWNVSLSFSGFGRSKEKFQVKRDINPEVDGSKIEYQHGEVSEWYKNTPKGIEQGFTIDKALQGKGDLELSIHVGGSAIASLAGDGKTIDFLNSGVRVLRYDGLKVTDAKNRVLASRFEVKGDEIKIVVDDQGAEYPVVVDPLLTTPSWTAESDQTSAEFGYLVSTAGDVNGDGYSDVIIGANKYDNGETDEGRVFVYYGSASGLSATPNWTAESNQAGAEFGYLASTAGDVNGDGYSDVIVGALYYDNGQTDEGRAYVYHGSASGLSATPDWIAESDQANAHFGVSVSTAGDANGDGYSDVIVGASWWSNGQNAEGRAYVYLGSASGLSATPSWTAESDQQNADFGYSVSTAGDVNGDGYSDIVVGAHGWDNGGSWNQGRAYVYHGSATGLSPTPNLTVASGQANAELGVSVSTAGDVNGDGYSDVIIGAYYYDNGESNEGRSFVYYGSASGLSATPNWTSESNQADANFGRSVSAAGDVNGDGYSDVIVGAPLYDNGQTDEGRAYIYLGSASGLAASPDWTAESDQASANFGLSASTAGDVNGDGYSDIIIGANLYDNGQTDEGRAFVYYGAPGGLPAAASWTAESDQAGAEFGISVSTAGDVNGDGYSDVIIGANKYDNGQTDEGRVYVYYGSSTGLSPSPAWTAGSDQAGSMFGYSVSTAGDVNGDGYSDIIVGAYLYDNGQTDEGRAYVYYGSSSGLAASPSWIAESDQVNAQFGNSVSTAGDVNGDGYSDVIVGAPFYDNGQTDEGQVYVYHGSPSGLSASPNWTSESDQANAYMGNSVSTAGDVNGDGYSDVIVGAGWYSNGQIHEGRAFIYNGSPGGLETTPSWMAESDQQDACFGFSVSTAGDVNGDGYSDVIFGLPGWDGAQYDYGKVYVYYGSASGLSSNPNWTVVGNQYNGHFGQSVSTAGDVNGDGYSDTIIGAYSYDNGETDEGRVYVYYGSASGLSASPNWTAESNQASAELGTSVSTAGDVNGDGYSDVIVGSHLYDNGQTDEGKVFVYYGNSGGGLSIVPKQLKSDAATPISLLCTSDSLNSFKISAIGRSPLGRSKAKLEWEAKPIGTAFNGSSTGLSSDWQDTGTSGYTFNETVTGLTSGTSYHWRCRFRYQAGNSMGQMASQWYRPFTYAAAPNDLKTDPGSATYLKIAGSNTMTAGTTGQTITITAYCANGQVATSYSGSKGLIFSGANASAIPAPGVSPTCSDGNSMDINFGTEGFFTFINGQATSTMKLYKAESVSIDVLDALINANSNGDPGYDLDVNVSAGPRNQLLWVTQPSSSVTVGAVWSAFAIEITDEYGNRTSDTDSITISPSSDFFGGTISQEAVSGLATFNDITFDTASSITVTGSIMEFATTAESNLVTVNPGSVNYLAVTGTGAMSAGGSQTITIKAYDQYNNVVTSYSGDKSLIFSGAAASPNPSNSPTCSNKTGDDIPFGAGTTISFTNGQATSTMKLYKAESISIDVSDGTYNSAANTSYDLDVSVSTGTKSKLLWSTHPTSPVTAGSTWNVFTVEITDDYGNRTIDTDNVIITPSSGSLSGTTSKSAVSGLATFTNITNYSAIVGLTLSASSGSLTTATSSNITVLAGTKNKLKFSTQPPGLVTAGATWTSFTVEITDAYDNRTSDADEITITPSTGSLVGTTAISAVSGLATFDNISYNTALPGITVSAASGSLTGATSSSINVNAAATNYLKVTGSGSMTAGGAQTITITACDQYGNRTSSYTGDKDLTFSGASASPNPATNPTCTSKTSADVPFATATTITFASGQATSTMKLYKAESISIDVTDGTYNSTGDTSYDLDVVVSAGAKNKLLWSTQPATPVTAGALFPAFTIEITDAYGNRTSDTDSISVAPSSGSFGGTTSQAAISGLATFNNITFNTSTSITVTGTVSGLTSTSPSGSVTINPASVNYLAVTGTATMAAGGSQTITIKAYDQYNNIATSYTGDKDLTFSGASASPNPATSPTCTSKTSADVPFATAATITFASGQATSTMKLYKAESISIDVTDGTYNSTGDTSYDLDVVVSAGAKNKLLWSTQPATPVTAGTTWTAFTIEITDAYGNRTSDTDSITVAPSSGSFGGTTSQAAISGLATFNNITFNTSTSITVTGTVSGLTSTSPSGSVTINPASVNYLAVTGTATMAAGGSQTITIKAYDQYNNIATSYTGDKDLTFSGASASPNPATNSTCTSKTSADIPFATATTITFASGQATSTMKLYKAESISIDVTDGTYNSTGDTSYDLDVVASAGAKNKLLWSTQPATSVTAGATWTVFTIEITDAYGNRTSDTDSITVAPSSGLFGGTTSQAAISGLATFNNITFNTATSITVTGTVSGLTSTSPSGSVTINPASVNYLAVTGTATMAAGGSQTITIKAYDQYNNIATSYTGDKDLTFSGASVSPNPATNPTCTNKTSADVPFATATTITFASGQATSTMKLYKAESISIDVTDGTYNSTANTSYDLDVVVSAGAKNKLLWSTQPATSVTAGATWTAFTIEITDAYGNRTSDTDSITVAPSSGSFGGTTSQATISGLATFNNITFNTSTSITVTGTVSGLTSTSPSGSVTINPASVNYLAVTGTATMAAGGSQTITIKAYDQYNNIATSYTGDKDLTFSGASASPNPATSPTCTSKTSADVPFATATTITFASGQATSTMKLYKAESISIDVTDGTYNSTGDTSYDLDVVVSAGAKNKLLWSTQPVTPVTAGATWTAFTIEITDAYGNRTSDTDSITVAPSSGLFGGTYSKAAVSGIATFNDITFSNAGTITVTGSGSGLISTASSGSVAVSSASANNLIITGSGTMTSGNSQIITIRAYDVYGNVATDYTGDKSLTFSGANASPLPATNPTCTDKSSSDTAFGNSATITFASGQATSTMKLYKAESISVDVSDGSINSNGNTTYDLDVTVSAATKNKLLWSTQPSTPVTAGATWTAFSIEITDTFGNRTTDTDSITITPSSGSFGGTTSKPAVSGLATFGDITYNIATTISVTGSATGLTPTSVSNNVVVNSAGSGYLKVTGSAGMTAGDSQTITITAYDQFGNVETTYQGDKNLIFSGASTSPTPVTYPTCSNKSSADINFGSTTVVTFTNGQATSTMKLYKAESTSIDVTDGSISTIDPTYDLDLTVSSKIKNKLLWVTSPSTPVTAGSTWTAFSIEITDVYGNRTSDTDSVIINPSSGSFGGTTSKPAVAGLATFSDITFNLATTITLTGTGTGVNATSASGNVVIDPATVNYLKITGSSSITAGGSETITIKAYDTYGNVATSYAGDKTLIFSGANSSINPATNPTCTDKTGTNIAFGTGTTLTFTSGQATSTMRLYKTESISIDATDGTYNSNGDTSYDLDVTVSAGTKSKLLWSTQPAISVTAGATWTAFVIEITDAYGNRTSDTDNVIASPSSGLFGGTTTRAATSGLATFSDITYSTATNITVTGTSGSLTATSSSSSITVNPATASYLKVTGTGTQTAGASQIITITAYDQYNNTATSYTGDKTLTFFGANASPNPATSPTCTDKNSATVSFGTATTLTFASGQATSTMRLYKSESISVDVTDGTVNSNGDTSYDLDVTVSAGTKSKLLWSTQPVSPVTAGATWTAFTIEITDAYGNRTSDTDNVIASPSSGSFGGTTTRAAASGLATFNDITYSTATNITVTGTSGSLTATLSSSSITVNPATASYLKVTGTGTQTVGAPQTITITAYDQYNNTATSYTGDNTLTFSGANASPNPATSPTCTDKNSATVSFGTASTLTFASGQATSTMSLYKGESISVDVTDGTVNSNGDTSYDLDVTVSAGIKSKLLWSTQPATSVTAGATWTAFTIEITDAYGNRTSDTDNVIASPSSGSFGGTTTRAAASGLATFNDITYSTATNITVTGTSGSLTATSASSSITVNPATASYLKVTGTGTQTAGASQTITITAYDQYNNTATSYTGDKTLTFSGANASPNPATSPTCTDKNSATVSFGTATTLTFASGQATSTMRLYKGESISVDVTDGTVNSNGDTSYDLDVLVSAGTKSKLIWSTQPATSVTAGVTWTAFTIEITDAYGNRTSDTDNVLVSSSSGSFGGTTTRAAASGLATFNDITYSTATNITVTGTSGSLTGTSTSSSITVNPAAAINLKVTGTGTQTAGASQTITITAYDQYNNISTSYTGDKTLTFSGANASPNPATSPTCTDKNSATVSFGTATTLTFASGQATSIMRLYKGESISVDVTDGTVNSNGDTSYDLDIVVSAGTKSKLLWSTQPATSVTAGATWTAFTIEITDAYGNRTSDTDNVIASPSSGSFGGTTTRAATSGLATFSDITYSTAANITVTGTSGSLTATSASSSITVNPATASYLKVTGTGTQTAGASQTITITAYDQYNNTATSYTGDKTLTFSGANASPNPATSPTCTDKNSATVSFGTATTLTFASGQATSTMRLYKGESISVDVTDGTVNSNGDTSYDLDVVVSAGIKSKLLWSTQPVTSVTAGATWTAFTIEITDAYGNRTSDTDNVIASPSSGLFGGTTTRAAASGLATFNDITYSTATNITVTGTSGSLTATSSSSSITVNPATASYLKVTGTGTQTAGASQTITITAYDQYNNTATSYTGDKTLTFSGANASPNPATSPTCTDKNSATVSFGTATTITFASGQATSIMRLYKGESISVDVTDGTVNSNGDTSYDLDVLVSAGIKSKLLWSTEPATSVTAGATWTAFTIEITDAYGNRTSDTDNVIASPSFGSFGGTTTRAAASGLATFNDITYSTATNITVNGTSGGMTATSASSSITVNPATVSYLKVTGTGTQTAGASQTITITAYDQYNNISTSYTGDKALTFTGANASTNPATSPTCTDKNSATVSFGTATTLTFASGQATSTMRLYKSESISVDVTDGIVNSNGDTSYDLDIVVSAGIKSKLLWSTQPVTSVTAGATWTAFTIEITDSYGNRTSDTDNVLVSPSSGSFGGTTTRAAVSGLATFNDITYSTATNITVNGTSGSLTATSSSSSITVNPATASYLKVTGTGTQTAGASQTITITAYDQYNNTATSYTGDKTLTFSGANASPNPATSPTCTDKNSATVSFGTATTLTFASGQATSTMRLYKSESISVDVTDGTVNSNGDTSYDLDIVVSPGTKSKLLWSTQPATSVTAGATWTAFTIEITDAYGNRTSDTDIITVSPSFDVLNGTTTITAVAGLATFNNISYNTAMTITVTGSATGLTDTPPSNSVTISPSQANRLEVTGSSAMNAGSSQVINIKAYDTYGNKATDYAGDKTLTFTGANSSSSPVKSPTCTDKSGSDIAFGNSTIVSFSNGEGSSAMKLYKAEDVSIDVSDQTIHSNGSPSYDLDVKVSPAAKSKLLWFSQPPSTVSAGAIWSAFSIEITDSYGNRTQDTDNIIITPSSGSIEGTLIKSAVSGLANFNDIKCNTASMITLTGSASGLTNTPVSNNVTVSSESIDHFSFSTISSPQTAGIAFSITITAKDAYNNTVTGYSGTNSLSDSTGTISPTVTDAFTNGSWTGNVIITKSMQSALITTTGSGKGSQSNTFDINHGSLYRFTFDTITDQIAGILFNVKIYARDVNDNIVTSFTGSVDITSTGSLMEGTGSTAAFTNGQITHQVKMRSPTTTGYTITATKTSGSETGTSNSFKVNEGVDKVFVDDDYSDTDCGGHTWRYDAFNNIGDGVNAVKSQGKVIIASGNYNEQIVIRKPMTLLGEGVSPVISAGGSQTAVTIDTSNVTLTGLTIQDADTCVAITSGKDNEIYFTNFINGKTWLVNNTSGSTLNAQKNWWGDSSGPGSKINGYLISEPWSRAKIKGFKAGEVSADASSTIQNGTLGLSLDIKTNSSGKAVPVMAKYTGNSTPVVFSQAFIQSVFDCMIAEGEANIDQLTLKLYYPDNHRPLSAWWFDGSTWKRCSDYFIKEQKETVDGSTYAGHVEILVNKTSTSPKIEDLTGTIFGLGDPERDLLTDLYNNTSGNLWSKKDNWQGDPGTENRWYGVMVDSQEIHVHEIDLSNNKLSGSIPSSIGKFSNMTDLKLSQNKLNGQIPAEISEMTNLQHIELNGNTLSGQIPPEFINLTQLIDGESDLRWNSLYTSDEKIKTFLNQKQTGGDWESTQTVAPTNLATGIMTDASVELTWNPITYRLDSGGYEIYYANSSDKRFTLFKTTENKGVNKVTVTGLNSDTTYYFKLRTVTKAHAGNPNEVYSEYTLEVEAKTTVNSNDAPATPICVNYTDEGLVPVGSLKLTTSDFSDPENNMHLKTYWKVRRADKVYGCKEYDESFNVTVIANPMTEHTVHGLEEGMKYAWKVGYEDSGSGKIAWSKEYTFKVGASETDRSVTIKPGVEQKDYRMVSFVQWPDDPRAESVLGDELGGQYDNTKHKIGTYDPNLNGGSYIEYGNNLRIEPGKAYWFLSRKGMDISINGVSVSITKDVEAKLMYNTSNGDGWNMIACPNSASYYWQNVQVLKYDSSGNIIYGPISISDLPDDNPYIEKKLWRWDNGKYYDDTTLMTKYEGYWIKVKQDNLYLRYPVRAQATLSNPDRMIAWMITEGKNWIKNKLLPMSAIAGSDETPPQPMGGLDSGSGDKPVARGSDGGGGGGGCFINSINQ